MPQALVCRNCKEPFVFTGHGVELVGKAASASDTDAAR